MQVSSAAGGMSSTRWAATARIGCACRTIRILGDDRPAFVAAIHDGRIERDLTKEGHSELVGKLGPSAGSEDRVVAARLRS